MTWQALLNKRLIQAHETTRDEIQNIRELISRDIKDAHVDSLSTDRKYATAYGAAVNLARLTAFCAGYRILSVGGHHQTSFDAAKLALKEEGATFCTYFNTCRRKRNRIDYDFAQVANESEVEDLLRQVYEFQGVVDHWIESNHPQLK